jgi:hypothetical protein
VSAPGLAKQLERQWRTLPSVRWSELGVRCLDRTLRKHLAHCFELSGHTSIASSLSNSLAVQDADAWRNALAMLKSIQEMRADAPLELLAAYSSVTACLPATLLHATADVFLVEASTVAIVLSNMSTGSFDPEFESQRQDIVTFMYQRS